MRGNEATGVEFFFNGTRNKVKARKEVILSAGTVGSPKILLLSGIGPAKHLRELEVNEQQNAKLIHATVSFYWQA